METPQQQPKGKDNTPILTEDCIKTLLECPDLPEKTRELLEKNVSFSWIICMQMFYK